MNPNAWPTVRSSISELAEAVGVRVFLMLRAYFDESGINRASPVCGIGGFVAHVEKWKIFERRWKNILRDFQVTEFHAKDFFNVTQGVRRKPPYKHWNAQQCESFIDGLINAVRAARPKVISVTLRMADFESFNDNERRLLTGAIIDDRTWKFQNSGAPTKPYFALFAAALYTAMKCVPGRQRIATVFDRNEHYVGWAMQHFQSFKGTKVFQNRFTDLVFSESSVRVGLQAADLFAYLNRKLGECELKGSTMRPDYLHYLNGLSVGGGLAIDFDKETMTKLLDGTRIPALLRSPFSP